MELNPEESSSDNGSAVIVFEGGSLIAFGSQVPNFHTIRVQTIMDFYYSAEYLITGY